MTVQTQNPVVAEFFDQDTNTFSYVVSDQETGACAVIDSVWNLDYASGSLSTYCADNILGYIESQGLTVEWIIETHVHADHISASEYIKANAGGKIAIGKDIVQVQNNFAGIYNLQEEFSRDGSQFDYLFEHGEKYSIGNVSAKAIHTPGHTPACMTHLVGDCAFVGDTLFMPDQGTARADFPGGSASELYESIDKILSLPDSTKLYMCHDYSEVQPEREFVTTVAQEREHNIHVRQGISKSAFVKMREERDATLDMPRYILPAIQINMRAGHLPAPESNGLSFLKIPLNAFSTGGDDGD